MKDLLLGCILSLVFIPPAEAQYNLENLKAFEVGKNWQIAGDVWADMEKDQTLYIEKGTGVLANLPDAKRKSNLLTRDSYGDVDVSMDFMMARHSNSGIYLMGRYEVQLLDSWGVKNPRYGDLGGIYQRRRPDGSQFEGHAPRINAAKAPGTWQHIYISFRAPRFDAQGNKTENAKILKVVLNGYTIHENVELTGPTGGPISETEASEGPIMIQGDHGPVAFRNIEIREFKDPDFILKNVSRTLYRGEIRPLLRYNWEGMESETEKVKAIDISDISEELGWATVFEGEFTVPETGNYIFSLQAGGESQLLIDGSEVVKKGWTRTQWSPRNNGPIRVEKGDHKFILVYSKVDGWLSNGLDLFVEADHIRRKSIGGSKAAIIGGSGEGPVYINTEIPRVIRSFIAIPDGDGEKVLTHVVNVGSPTGLHYTYDTSNGRLVKIWRGGFLDVSPMWKGRGNAQALSQGVELILNTDTSKPEGYKSRGYDIDAEGYPIFRYSLNGSEITDQISTDGKQVTRTIKGAVISGSRVVISRADKIEQMANGVYAINDKEYFISSDSPLNLIEEDGKGVLSIKAVGDTVVYSIIW